MGFQSIYEDKSDREDMYEALLNEAVADANINNSDLAKCLDKHEGEIDLYIRTGWNEIIAILNDEIVNSGDCKDFLETVGDSGNTVIETITAVLL